MKAAIHINLPGVPRAWARARLLRTARGSAPRFFNTAETTAYRQALQTVAKAAMRGRSMILTEPVFLKVDVLLPIPERWSKKQLEAVAGTIKPMWRPDLDNYLKLINDALTGIVWNDDAQVTDGAQRKRYSNFPGINVSVWELEPDD